jgi:hypothetical protein
LETRLSGEAELLHPKLQRYFENFLHGFESGLGKGYTRISSDDISILSPDLYYYRYDITEPIHRTENSILSFHMRVYQEKDDYEIKILIGLKLATKIESWYEVLVANKYRYICIEDFCGKIVKTTPDDDPFDLGYRLGSEFREMIRDLRRASSRDERLKWVLGIEVLRILMVNDIAMNRNSPLVKIAEYIDRLYGQISDEDRAIFEDYMAMLGSAGVYHKMALYNAIINTSDPSKYGTSLLTHLIEKGEIRLRRDGLYVKGRKIEPLYFGKNGVFIGRDHWRRIYARYIWLHIKYRYYGKLLDELTEYGYDPVDAGRMILLTILYNKDMRDRDWNLANEVMRFSFIKIRGRDGGQVDLVVEIVRRRPDLASIIINKVVESEPLSPMAIDYLMRKIGDYVSEKEKIAMLNKLFIKALNMIASDSGVSREKIPWFSMVSIVKSIPRLRNAIYHSSGWKTMVLMMDGGRMCIPLYLESRGGSIGGIFGFYYYDDDYGDVLVPIKIDDIDIIGKMSEQDIEKIWSEMKKLLINPQSSALVELVELREDIKIPIIDMFSTAMPLSDDMVRKIRMLAKNIPIAAVRVS